VLRAACDGSVRIALTWSQRGIGVKCRSEDVNQAGTGCVLPEGGFRVASHLPLYLTGVATYFLGGGDPSGRVGSGWAGAVDSPAC
jgi:hypothetical protein